MRILRSLKKKRNEEKRKEKKRKERESEGDTRFSRVTFLGRFIKILERRMGILRRKVRRLGYTKIASTHLPKRTLPTIFEISAT